MGLSKLGNFIEQSDLRNHDGALDVSAVVGLSTAKEIITTKANMDGVGLTGYKLLPPHYFAYVPDTSRRGDKMSLGYNTTEQTFLVSSISVVFKTINGLNSDYLYMYFNRPEFDRYARFNSWGSAREAFSWDDMCDITIDLPPLPIQQKYVAVYNAMLANQRAYEQGLEDLKLTCDAYIERLRKNLESVAIGRYIEAREEKNRDLKITVAQGVNTEKFFVFPKQVADDARNAQIVRTGQFAYNKATTRNGEKLSIAYRTGCDCVVSSAYQVFEVTKKDKLLPEYLMMWFKRSEFDRYVRYNSWGSAHEFFPFEFMCEVKIPIPDIKIQQAIVNIYNAYVMRREIKERLKAQIKDICPILIKGSLEEANA
ncbi:MAG: restriction endonuclease subunit S [Clostridium sp.]|jgi:type I restriction enzyme S subunit|nr:restriction endonuclease subunit S [Clostridium sp.]